MANEKCACEADRAYKDGMNAARIIVIACFLVLLGIPLVVPAGSGGEVASPDEAARSLIIVSPHNEQIRREFGSAFSQWHYEHHGERVNVIWNAPGGTSEIRRMLEAQYRAALREGVAVGGTADLVMGGGSYEFSKLKEPIEETVDDHTRTTTITAPVEFEQSWLDEVYGENTIANGKLYDPEGYWYGAALSGFGIVYNRDALEQLNLPEPVVWSDLCTPTLRGWLALVNPAQSGSITTAFDTILQRLGWRNGWAVLRRCGANARYFSASSIKPPLDVSQGDAAAGICIDFYGRYQAQAVKDAGGGNRIGYVDPPGLTTIDADPVAMLRGARDPELAKRFIRFTLSVQGQSLWQFRVDEDIEDGLGPQRFELRRMVIRRDMYETHFDRFIDQVNPFEIGTPIENPNSDYRAYIAVLFNAMAMDSHHELREAWAVIVEHPAYPRNSAEVLVTAEDVNDPTLAAMLEAFDALPTVPGPDGQRFDLNNPADLEAVKGGWLRGGWADERLWPEAARPTDVLRRRLGAFFRRQYADIVRMAETGQPIGAAAREPAGR